MKKCLRRLNSGRPRAVFWLGLSAVLVFAACGSKPAPRNLILVTLDTTRADHISAISPGRASTPNLDWLAGQGTLYKNCYSLIPITMPSHASIFYSAPPHRLKNYNNGQRLRNLEGKEPLASVFARNGFATGAFVSLGVVRRQFGLDNGFKTYIDDFPPDRGYLSAGEVNAGVLPWLESHKDTPFFAWIHYSDPHEPYTPPGEPNDLDIYVNDKLIGTYCLSDYAIHSAELPLQTGYNEIRFEVKNDNLEFPYQARFDLWEFKGPEDESGLKIEHYRNWYIRHDDGICFFKRTASVFVSNTGKPRRAAMNFRGRLILPIDSTVRRDYAREVEYMDGEIGRLWTKLKDLGLFETTAIVVAGDHGEGLGEYNTEGGDRHIGHIHFLQDVYMHVPLIISSPAGRARPSVREEFVTLLDIAPTIAGIMGFKRPSYFQGRDLARLRKGERLDVFEETYAPEAEKDRFGLLSYPWHLIFTPAANRHELYNLKADPAESNDLARKDSLPEEVIALNRTLEARAREVLKTKEPAKLQKDAEDILRSLGYIK